MDIDTINMIRRVLPTDMPFPYYADRESAWLLAQLMRADATVAQVRSAAEGKLLDRPLVKPLVAGCGGMLRQRDVLALAHADKAMAWRHVSSASLAALDPVYASAWQDFTLSFAAWGGTRHWRDNQLSRPGVNLVVQLGFPTEHAQIFGRYFDQNMRRKLEYSGHPIREDGPPTLAWARLDVDLETGTALVEEVQCDWIRFVRWEKMRRAQNGAQDREMRVLIAYEQALLRHYAKSWPRVMLLAALYLLREELGVRDVWMHQHQPGAVLKNVQGGLPPRSLYTDLPRAFCFAPTRDAPAFLEKPRRRHLAHLRKGGHPLFWRIGL